MNEASELVKIRKILHSLGFSSRHTGYKALCIAIPSYAHNNQQSTTKELYPALRKQFGYVNSITIERPIRYAISEAWEHGDPESWQRYFPGATKAPSNTVFIAALAEYLD